MNAAGLQMGARGEKREARGEGIGQRAGTMGGERGGRTAPGQATVDAGAVPAQIPRRPTVESGLPLASGLVSAPARPDPVKTRRRAPGRPLQRGSLRSCTVSPETKCPFAAVVDHASRLSRDGVFRQAASRLEDPRQCRGLAGRATATVRAALLGRFCRPKVGDIQDGALALGGRFEDCLHLQSYAHCFRLYLA